MKMDKVIFGDNQFLGVDHHSSDRAKGKFKRFEKSDAILEVLGDAYDVGIRSFMFTTHDRYAAVFDEINRSNLFPDMKYFPCLPYGHKYADALAVKTPTRLIIDSLKGHLVGKVIHLIRTGLTFNHANLMKFFIDLELTSLRFPSLDGVFMQNLVTDLLLGLGQNDMLDEFRNYIKSAYGVDGGFITMNRPLLIERLSPSESGSIAICSNFNTIGFRMNPNKREAEVSLRRPGIINIALSVLASGAISPDEAFSYISETPGIHSVLFGASSKGNIQRTYNSLMS